MNTLIELSILNDVQMLFRENWFICCREISWKLIVNSSLIYIQVVKIETKKVDLSCAWYLNDFKASCKLDE